MSANHAIDVYEQTPRQSLMRRTREEARSFQPNRDTAIGLEVSVSLPVPMLHWPSRLFSDVHPMADGDQFSSVLNASDGRPTNSQAGSEMGVLIHHLISGNTHAGVAP